MTHESDHRIDLSQFPLQAARTLLDAATPVLRIRSLGGMRWTRNVPANDGRRGPWLQAKYDVLDERAWRAQGACLYLVAGDDRRIRYVGISRNGLKHRWRTSPAFCAVTARRLPVDELFHSQCWRPLQHEAETSPAANFEVRSIEADALARVIERIGGELAGFLPLRTHGESLVASVERWLCNHQSDQLVSWNSAMTRKKRDLPSKLAS